MIILYDEKVLSVSLTADEIQLIKCALDIYSDLAVSIGEEVTINELLEKLN